MSDKLFGVVTRVIYTKDDFNICVVKVDKTKINIPNDDIVTSVTHPNIKNGFIGEFHGTFETNPKYGKQFKAKFVLEQLPSTINGFKNYLKSGLFKGIGETTAQKIVDFLGENPINSIKENPDIILDVPKVKKALLEGIRDTWLSNSVKAEILVLLQQNGVTGANIDRVYNKFREKSISVITKNPYILIKEVPGIGFRMADKIAMNMGIPADSETRVTECIKYVLESDTNYGSCYLTRTQVNDKVRELIGIINPGLIDICLTDNQIVKLNLDGFDRYYSINTYRAEHSCLHSINDMLYQQTKYLNNISIDDLTLSVEQKKAVTGALSNKLSILTGGPGCGKTYTTKTIVDNLKHMRKKVAICAPTGKAAARSSEVIGEEALTIHRLLEFDFTFGNFTRNSDNPIEFDYLIVEESSMIDIKLMSNLLDAISDKCQVLFVGDYAQLPPIGAGSPFKDMIESGLIPTYTLNKIFRQGLDSDIIKSAHAINNGETVVLKSPIVNPGMWKDKTDFMFIDSDLNDGRRPNDYPVESTLRYNLDINKMIVKLYVETVKKYRSIHDIQILIPKRVGMVGCDNINSMIQDIVNPESTNPTILYKSKRFRLNDKVIHVKNNYELNVFNGEIGKILTIDVKNKTCIVLFDNKTINYKTSDLDDLELAFAITIHKSQGSEFGCVIMPLIGEHAHMSDRSLIYTGITRAKKLAIVIGKKQSFYQGIATTKNNKRQTSLRELIIRDNDKILAFT